MALIACDRDHIENQLIAGAKMASRLALLLMISGLGFATSVAAQPAATDASPSVAAGQSVTEELERFAIATVKLNALETREPEALAAAITGAGLTVERYNEIAARMGSDPPFAAKVNELLAKTAAQQSAGSPGANGPAQQQAAGGDVGVVESARLPTSGDGARVLEVLGNVCRPMVRQDQPVAVVAPKHGFRKNKKDGSYTRLLGSEPFAVTVLPRGANENVCRVELRYAVGGARPIVDALNAWAALQRPQLKMQRNDVATGADGIRRRTLSWEHFTPTESVGLVLVQLQKPDGSPLDQRFESATLLYSERRS